MTSPKPNFHIKRNFIYYWNKIISTNPLLFILYLIIFEIFCVLLFIIISFIFPIIEKYEEKISGTIAIIMIILLLFNIFIYFGNYFERKKHIKKIENEEKRKQEELEIKEIERKYLEISTKENELITNFIKKYSNLISKSLNPENEDDIDEELKIYQKLLELLNKKGYQITEKDLYVILSVKFKEYIKEKFLNEIKLFRNNSEKIIEYYIENYSNINEYKEILLDILNIDEYTLNNLIENKTKELELENFENKLKDKNSKNYSIKDIDSMSGYDFEKFLKELFQKMNYNVHHTTLSNDQGADLVIEKLNIKIVVQAKRQQNPVGNKAVQEVSASMKHYKCDKAIVVSNNYYTKSAISLAKSNEVELWDREKLIKLIDKYF